MATPLSNLNAIDEKSTKAFIKRDSEIENLIQLCEQIEYEFLNCVFCCIAFYSMEMLSCPSSSLNILESLNTNFYSFSYRHIFCVHDLF